MQRPGYLHVREPRPRCHFLLSTHTSLSRLSFLCALHRQQQKLNHMLITSQLVSTKGPSQIIRKPVGASSAISWAKIFLNSKGLITCGDGLLSTHLDNWGRLWAICAGVCTTWWTELKSAYWRCSVHPRATLRFWWASKEAEAGMLHSRAAFSIVMALTAPVRYEPACCRLSGGKGRDCIWLIVPAVLIFQWIILMK